jgi:hypothetical protein
LLTLVVWLLPGGERAQATFIVPNPLPSSVDSLNPGESGISEVLAAAKEPQPSDGPTAPTVEEALRLSFLWAALGLGPSGGSCGSTSGVTTVAGVVPAATLNHPTDLAPDQEARQLFFEVIQFHPPPFLARLFRPPRLG